MASEQKYRPSLSASELEDCVSALLSSNPNSSALSTLQIFCMKLKLGKVVPTNAARHVNVANSANSSSEPAWVNDPMYLTTEDQTLRSAYRMGINVYVTTDKYPPSLEPFIAEINAEKDKVKKFFSADDL